MGCIPKLKHDPPEVRVFGPDFTGIHLRKSAHGTELNILCIYGTGFSQIWGSKKTVNRRCYLCLGHPFSARAGVRPFVVIVVHTRTAPHHQSFTQHQLQNVLNAHCTAIDHEVFDYYDTKKLLLWHSDAEALPACGISIGVIGCTLSHS